MSILQSKGLTNKKNKMKSLDLKRIQLTIGPEVIKESSRNKRIDNQVKVERSNMFMRLMEESDCIFGKKAFDCKLPQRNKALPRIELTKELITSIGENKSQITKIFPYLEEPFTIDSYSRIFTTLLIIQEVQGLLDIREFDKENVIFRKEDNFLVLDVPGLEEGRPSLMEGDTVLCKPLEDAFGMDQKNSLVHQGIIYEIQKESIYIKFNLTFMKHYDDQLCDIFFQVGRGLILRLHEAVKNVSKYPNSKKLLFPDEIEFKKPIIELEDPVYWFNKNLNKCQRQAVGAILRAECRPSPYIVIGPPGTGKTFTIVEAILQIFFLKPKSRILACSGSNASADSIATKLIATGLLSPLELVRIISFTYSHRNAIPKNMKNYTQLCEDGNEKNWLNNRIIVSTCSNSTKFGIYEPGKRPFDFVFIDEASTLIEPESLLPILLVKENGLVVLAGDPHQLGPVVISPYKGQLKYSMIERLSFLTPYKRDEQLHKQENGYHDPRCVTKLVQSYRCCPELIKENSDFFYHSELQSDMQPNVELIKNFKNFPILFHGVVGRDEQVNNSPSWLNYDEAFFVTNYVDKLFKLGVNTNDIAVITPYRKQIQSIRAFLKGRFIYDELIPQVSTVETFQGLEKRVIILSLVRSFLVTNALNDTKYNISFVNSPKRFNVATSRAKELLIVIGNPYLLAKDVHWQSLIDYCSKNNSYVECEPSIASYI